jgi:pilus assembly protein CpaB
MNRRLLTILVLAFLIAAACAFVVYRLVGTRLGAAKPVATNRVLAAANDIKLGTILDKSSLTTIEIAGAPPKGTFVKPEDVIGRGVISDLYQGEPILDSRLAAPGTGGGLAPAIPLGMRACAVRVDDVVGVSGFVTPGMRVDVIISGIPPSATTNTQGTVAKTVLQNIQVLSAGTDIQKDAEGKAKPVQVVNLLVNPEQAETLTLAGNQNVKVQLVLRNPLDTKTEEVPGTAMENIFAGKVGPPAKGAHSARVVSKPAPKVFTVEVINGATETKEKFSTPEAK